MTEIAARKGVRKSTISEKLARLVDAGKVHPRPGKGRVKLVNLAEYDLAVGEVGDVARETGAETKGIVAGESSPASPRYRDAATRDKEYAADLKFIELEQKRFNLLPVADVRLAAQACAAKIVEIVEGAALHASDLTGAATREGETGVRSHLKRMIRDQRAAIQAALERMVREALATAAPPEHVAMTQAELPMEE